jgi:hypothetical protein
MMILKNYNTIICDSNSLNLIVTSPCDDLNTFLNSISKASFCSGVENGKIVSGKQSWKKVYDLRSYN